MQDQTAEQHREMMSISMRSRAGGLKGLLEPLIVHMAVRARLPRSVNCHSYGRSIGATAEPLSLPPSPAVSP